MNTVYCTTLPDMTVDILARDGNDFRIMHGNAVLNKNDKELLFVEDNARGRRSTELMRTPHGRLVRRPDGNYTLTFRFSSGEDDIQASLVGEMIDMCVDSELIDNQTF